MIDICDKIPFSKIREGSLRVYIDGKLSPVPKIAKTIGMEKRSLYRYIKKYSSFKYGDFRITVRDFGSTSRYTYYLEYNGSSFEKDSITDICDITGWNCKTLTGVYGRLSDGEQVNYRGSTIKKKSKYS